MIGLTTKINWHAYVKWQRGYCCGSPCENCPYDPKGKPEENKSTFLDSDFKEIIDSIAVENAPCNRFRDLHPVEQDELVRRLKTRKLQASEEDFVTYFGEG